MIQKNSMVDPTSLLRLFTRIGTDSCLQILILLHSSFQLGWTIPLVSPSRGSHGRIDCGVYLYPDGPFSSIQPCPCATHQRFVLVCDSSYGLCHTRQLSPFDSWTRGCRIPS